MTLHQLKILEAVARHGSITGAAKELRISQPSVFKQVKTLEQSCEVKLYRKSGRGVELTPEGREFETSAREILRRLETLQQKYRAQQTLRKKTLSIGASHAPSVSSLPGLLTTFRKHHPTVQVSLQTRSSRAIELLLLSSQIEVGIITHPSGCTDYSREPYRNEKVVVFVSRRHPLAKKRVWTIDEIAGEPLMLHKSVTGKTGDATLRLIKRIEEAGRKPIVSMECNSADSVKSAVLSGAGVGVLMEAHLHQEIRRGELTAIRIKGLESLDNQSFVIYPKDRNLSPAARDFLALLQGSFRPLMESGIPTAWPSRAAISCLTASHTLMLFAVT